MENPASHPRSSHRCGYLEIAPALSATVDAELSLPEFTGSQTASLQVSAATLSWTAGTGPITLAAPPWLAPVQLFPPPPATVLRRALTDPLPLLAASAALSGALNSLEGEACACAESPGC